ncbi:MAG TPA: hypothetical protein VE954_04015 [Oligoflexus sp.]|nr:hypothetical protein [Oligoflexus sp.]
MPPLAADASANGMAPLLANAVLPSVSTPAGTGVAGGVGAVVVSGFAVSCEAVVLSSAVLLESAVSVVDAAVSF